MAVAVKAEHLERVDALAAAVDHVGLPHAATLVGDAVGLLGSTLRDARAVERVLDALPRRHGWAIRGLLVASGLLGVAPDPERWLPYPEDAPAGVYATIIADLAAASEALRALLTRPIPAATSQVISDALAQVRAGEWLAAIG
jgi:hypothetical protein